MTEKPVKGPNKVVCDVLSESKKPLGAYDILERVKVKGINAPPQIYRALEKLMKLGLAHRIASKHSYMMCKHGGHKDESIIFAICNSCDNVDEIPNKALHTALENVRINNGFKVESEVVEIVGTCRKCNERGAH